MAVTMRLVLMGPPGAGKGTLAKALAEQCGLPHVSSGDIFRGEIRRGTDLGKKIEQYLAAGALVPDAITVKAVLARLSAADAAAGWVLDGFPRTEGQARALDRALKARKERLTAVVDLAVGQDTIVRRMAGRRSCPACGRVYHVENLPPRVAGRCDACGADLVVRQDDQPGTVRARLKTYRAQTAPLVEYYAASGRLLEMDGDGTPEEVRARLFEQLEKRRSA
jgi:adenylate kinase